ncbi:PaaI family thioesterase [Aquincola sp. MAHUQ-54]|uniref:PaaI family thioesterase n=1 Tax=Aquincola agrisoli TaxID=3119538 RepID=A0AAW9Q4J6_9BURK
MLRTDITLDDLHARQRGTLPDRYGFRLTGLAEGRLASRMQIEPWMLAPNGFLHAASVILLADTTAGYATIAHLPAGARSFTTIELKNNFLGTAREGTLTCECTAEHLGRSTHVWSATVLDPGQRRIALFRCTQMILQ